jgi:hypothetical protein
MKRVLVVLALLILPCIALPAHVAAVDVFERGVCSKGGDVANSSVCKDKNLGGQNPLFGPQGVITRIINILTVVVGIAAVIVIILAGLKFITSGSNPQDISNARERIIYAVIALIIAASAQALVRYVLRHYN